MRLSFYVASLIYAACHMYFCKRLNGNHNNFRCVFHKNRPNPFGGIEGPVPERLIRKILYRFLSPTLGRLPGTRADRLMYLSLGAASSH